MPELEGEKQSATTGDTTQGDDQGRKPKMVPESDLIAAKRGLEKQIDELKSTHTEESKGLKTQFDTEHSEHLKSQAEVERLNTQLQASSATADELSKSKDDLTKLQESYTKLQEAAKSNKVDLLVTKFGVDNEQIKEKTMDELGHLEEALTLVGAKPGQKTRFDTGSGGAGAATDPHALAAAEIAQAKQRSGVGKE